MFDLYKFYQNKKENEKNKHMVNKFCEGINGVQKQTMHMNMPHDKFFTSNNLVGWVNHNDNFQFIWFKLDLVEIHYKKAPNMKLSQVSDDAFSS